MLQVATHRSRNLKNESTRLSISQKINNFIAVVLETYNGRPDLESYWDTLHFYRAFPIAHCCFGMFSLFWRLFLRGPLLTWSQEVCSLLVTLIGCNKRYVFTKVHWRWAHQTENATFEWYWSFLRSLFRKQGLVEIHILTVYGFWTKGGRKQNTNST